MLENSQVKYHAKKVIDTIDRIVVSLTLSPLSETDHSDLVRLGKLLKYEILLNIFYNQTLL